jgi:hypothetical protein
MDKSSLERVVFRSDVEKKALVLHKIPGVGSHEFGPGLKLGMRGPDEILLGVADQEKALNALILAEVHKTLGRHANEIKLGIHIHPPPASLFDYLNRFSALNEANSKPGCNFFPVEYTFFIIMQRQFQYETTKGKIT